jgi:Bifunctional DNA primase/polymerase, N-terminal/Protein of unknown function (DUF3987)
MTRTASANGAPPLDVRQAAGYYLDRGWLPIPVPFKGKDPHFADWQLLRPTREDLDRLFPEGEPRNLGLLLGEPSRGLVDTDLDTPEAIAAAKYLLPPTDLRHGREGKRESHFWFQVDDPPNKSTAKFTDPDGTCLIELRSTTGQTVVPPSVHESGEPIAWESWGEPAVVPLDELRSAVCAVAAAALLSRHWPAKGSRHDMALALSGGLLRGGWEVARVERFVRAVCVAAKTGDVETKVRTVRDTKEKLDAGEEVTGWPRVAELLRGHGEAVVRRVRNWLGMSAGSRVGDVPIPETLPWPDPPGEEAFHGLAGDIVRAIEPASEADPVAILVQTLVAFGNVIGRSVYFEVESDRHYTNEFIVLVGRTAKARKGTSWGHVERLFRAAEETWVEEHIQTGLSSGEGLIWAVRDPITKRERVKERGQPARYEEVEADPGVSDKRLLVFEPEFANVLKQTERQGNILSAIMRPAWDGRTIRTLTKNSPAKASGAHISNIGHITADEFRRYLTVTETANGFANRYGVLCAERSKVLPEGGQVDPKVLEALAERLRAAAAFARRLGDGKACGHRMERSEDARQLWREVYGELSEGKPGLTGALLARSEAHVLRLSMLYALLDCSPVITAEHLLAALALWDYCERSVRYVFGDTLGDSVADELLQLLRGCPGGLTRTEMSNYFQRNVSAERIGRALGLLLQHKLARREQEKTGGRPTERWYATNGGKR